VYQDTRKKHPVSKRAFRMARIAEAGLVWRVLDQGFDPKDRRRSWEQMTDLHDLELNGLTRDKQAIPVEGWAERVAEHENPKIDPTRGTARDGHEWWNECSCSFSSTIRKLQKVVMTLDEQKIEVKRAVLWNGAIAEVKDLTDDELLTKILDQEEKIKADKVRWEAYYTHRQQRLLMKSVEERERQRKLENEKRVALGQTKPRATSSAKVASGQVRQTIALTDDEKASRGITKAIQGIMAGMKCDEAKARAILGLPPIGAAGGAK
jgi:hypothetical protein